MQILNFGTIKPVNLNNNTTVDMYANGTLRSSTTYIAEGYYQGILRYNNDTSTSVKPKITSPSSVKYTCVSNCNSACTNTNSLRSFKYSPSLPTGSTTVGANSYSDWNIGGMVTIYPNCTGVFEGTLNFTSNGQTVSVPTRMVVGDIQTISVTPQDDLDFGDILSTTASTVTVGTNGVRTCSPASVCVANQSSNGTFRVENSSATAQTFTVDCPSGAVQMGNGSNFYIDSFICSTSSNSVSSSAPATVNVGATLHVPQGQASGEYNTTYTITVNN